MQIILAEARSMGFSKAVDHQWVSQRISENIRFLFLLELYVPTAYDPHESTHSLIAMTALKNRRDELVKIFRDLKIEDIKK